MDERARKTARRQKRSVVVESFRTFECRPESDLVGPRRAARARRVRRIQRQLGWAC